MALRYIIHTAAEKTMTIAGTPTVANISGQRSPWHSPVPYLFGGLAAMLGLIAFALLVLACSYWRLSGYLERDLEAGESNDGGDGTESDDVKKTVPAEPVLEDKFLVIMAGQQVPTCLATPMWSRASSFGSTSKSSTCTSTSCSTSSNTEATTSFLDENKDKTQQGLTTNPTHQQGASSGYIVQS